MKSNVYRIIYEDIFHFYDDKFITVHAIKKYQKRERLQPNYFSIA